MGQDFNNEARRCISQILLSVHDPSSPFGSQTQTNDLGQEEKRGSDRTYWPVMKSQQKPLGGSVVCGRSSAVPAAAAAPTAANAAAAAATATAARAEPVCEPWPLSRRATSVAMRNASAGVFLGEGAVVSRRLWQGLANFPGAPARGSVARSESNTKERAPPPPPSHLQATPGSSGPTTSSRCPSIPASSRSCVLKRRAGSFGRWGSA